MMTSSILRTIAIGILAGTALFFFPFVFRFLFFVLIIGLIIRLFAGHRYRRWGRPYWREERRDEMPASFMSTHYHHRSGITPLYHRPEGTGPENEVRVS